MRMSQNTVLTPCGLLCGLRYAGHSRWHLLEAGGGEALEDLSSFLGHQVGFHLASWISKRELKGRERREVVGMKRLLNHDQKSAKRCATQFAGHGQKLARQLLLGELMVLDV